MVPNFTVKLKTLSIFTAEEKVAFIKLNSILCGSIIRIILVAPALYHSSSYQPSPAVQHTFRRKPVPTINCTVLEPP
jgi:hypothetical protein